MMTAAANKIVDMACNCNVVAPNLLHREPEARFALMFLVEAFEAMA